ncbi:MAG TPA: UbiA family prenyltransferase [Dehalococcoidales bacterium]|nr:UbiA family prenyltransferase [Dehalococcoidales bacterium]
MKDKISTHIGLGRFFALPIAACSVLLGVALGGHWSWLSAMVCLGVVFQMAFAHSFNTLLDYSWTGLDKGTEAERSRGKIYTHGQQEIASGKMTPKGVLLNGLVYLAISAVFIGIVAWQVSPIIWAIWGIASLCTFWYSWGKLHFQCEIALGTGFGPLAVMMGMASQPNPDFLLAFLAGIPALLLFGYGAETLDQFIDAEPNWPRGLRNFGALVWRNNASISTILGWLLSITFLSQLFLITGGVLHPLTALTLITFLPFSMCLLFIESKPKVGIIWGLGGIYLYCLLLLLGEVPG